MASVRRKKVFCTMCGTAMQKAPNKPDAHTRDELGRLLEVVRVFYWCPACHTIVWFDYRKDGKEGDLHRALRTGTYKPDAWEGDWKKVV